MTKSSRVWMSCEGHVQMFSRRCRESFKEDPKAEIQARMLHSPAGRGPVSRFRNTSSSPHRHFRDVPHLVCVETTSPPLFSEPSFPKRFRGKCVSSESPDPGFSPGQLSWAALGSNKWGGACLSRQHLNSARGSFAYDVTKCVLKVESTHCRHSPQHTSPANRCPENARSVAGTSFALSL